MLYDPLQAKLRKMERREPSLNRHKKSLSGILADSREFFRRYRAGEVEGIKQQAAHSASPKAMADDIRQLFRDTAPEYRLNRYALMQICHAVKLAEDAWPASSVEERIEVARFWAPSKINPEGMSLIYELIGWNCPE